MYSNKKDNTAICRAVVFLGIALQLCGLVLWGRDAAPFAIAGACTAASGGILWLRLVYCDCRQKGTIQGSYIMNNSQIQPLNRQSLREHRPLFHMIRFRNLAHL